MSYVLLYIYIICLFIFIYNSFIYFISIYIDLNSKNFWEFNLLPARHHITRYYELLPVITRYYPLLRVTTRYYPLLPVITRYYPLLPVITRYYPLLPVITFYWGKRFENFWEFNWLGACHLITRYCPFRRGCVVSAYTEDMYCG